MAVCGLATDCRSGNEAAARLPLALVIADPPPMRRSFALVTLALSACAGTPAPRGTTPVVAAAEAMTDPCAGVAPLPVAFGFACLPAGSGSYRMELEELTEVRCELCVAQEVACEEDAESDACLEPGVVPGGRFRLVYVSDTGERAVGAPQAFRDEPGRGDERVMTFEVLAVFDFDGDGRSELAAALSESYDETGDRSTQLVTPVGTSLVPYAPAADFSGTIADVRDVDADGRPDFVSLLPWFEGGFGYSESSSGTGGPNTLHHSLVDGTFADDDDAARAYTREACGGAGAEGTALVPSLTGDPDEVWSLLDDARSTALLNVTCVALLEGADIAGARLTSEWAQRPCTFDEAECARLGDTLRARVEAVAAW